MRNRSHLLGSVAALAVLAASSAFAQEDFGWNGAFVGADVGLGMGATQRLSSDGLGGYAEDGSLGSEALTGGLFAGFDVEVSEGLVFGIEAGLDFFNSEASTTQSTLVDTYQFRSLGAAYAGVRAGLEIAPRTLVYGRVAYAAIHAQVSEELVVPKQSFLNGYQVAAGIETEVTDNVTLRMEGTYTAAIESLVSGDLDDYQNTPTHFGASIGVSYRFGGPSRGPRIDLEPKRSWSGGYVGALAGVLATSSVNGGLAPSTVEGPVASINGQYGAYLGVNVQVGDQFVIGAEGDISFYDATYDAVAEAGYDYATSDHKAQISARLGFLVNPDTLIYARAGYGLMHINPDEFNARPGTESAYVQSASAGLGVESMVSPNALLRFEALYNTALEEYRFADDSDPAPQYYVKPTSVEARVGAAFMF